MKTKHLLISVFLLIAASPAFGAVNKKFKSECRNRCKTQYSFCQKNARTAGMSKVCKATRKACKRGCGG